MALPKKRQAKSRTRVRKSTKKISLPSLAKCPNCGGLKFPHRACSNCGWWHGTSEKQKAIRAKK